MAFSRAVPPTKHVVSYAPSLASISWALGSPVSDSAVLDRDAICGIQPYV
jgi:hypothetical protein